MKWLKELFCKHHWVLDYKNRYFPPISNLIMDCDTFEFKEHCEKCHKVHSGRFTKTYNFY